MDADLDLLLISVYCRALSPLPPVGYRVGRDGGGKCRKTWTPHPPAAAPGGRSTISGVND